MQCCVIAGIDEADTSQLQVHPLLDVAEGAGQLRFRYKFLMPVFRARYLVRTIVQCSEQGKSLPEKAVSLMEQEATGSGFLLEHLRDFWGYTTPLSHLGAVFATLDNEHARTKSLLFHFRKA